MAGLFSNPLNWQITDSLQGQEGGINPLKAVAKYTSPLGYAADAVKDNADTPSWDVTYSDVQPQNATAPTGGDPTTTSTGSSGYGSGGYDATSILQGQNLVNQAQQMLDRLTTQKQTADKNLTGAYSTKKDTMTNEFGRNQGDYNTNYQANVNNKLGARSQVNQQLRQQAGLLMRLLGMAGASSGDVAQKYIPYLLARQGTTQQNQVNDTYAQNQSGLDQSWTRYKTDYDNSMTELENWYKTQADANNANYIQKQAEAQQQLANGQATMEYGRTGDAARAQAIINQAQPGLMTLMQQIDALGAQTFSPVVKDASYAAPSLADYKISNANTAGGVDRPQYQDMSPMYQQWLRKQQQETF